MILIFRSFESQVFSFVPAERGARFSLIYGAYGAHGGFVVELDSMPLMMYGLWSFIRSIRTNGKSTHCIVKRKAPSSCAALITEQGCPSLF